MARLWLPIATSAPEQQRNRPDIPSSGS